MVEHNLTNEAKVVFRYIKETLVEKYPTKNITLDYFIIAMMDNDTCVAHRSLERIALGDTLNQIYSTFHKRLTDNGIVALAEKPLFDKAYDTVLDSIEDTGDKTITTGHVLLSILKNDDTICSIFKKMGVTYEQIQNSIEVSENITMKSILKQKKKDKQKETTPTVNKPSKTGNIEVNDKLDEGIVDMNNRAIRGEIPEIIGNETVYEDIFATLSKKYNNNVIVVGSNGVGKTVTVRNIANLFISGNVPSQYKNKRLLEMDITSFVNSLMLRGVFETRFKSIINFIGSSDRYVLFIDDIHHFLSDKSRYNDNGASNMLKELLENKNIQLVCTTSYGGYKNYIESDRSIATRFTKIVMKEKSEKESVDIINNIKERFEKFHNVQYENEAVETAVKLSKRYITGRKLPESALDLLDETGARKSNSVKEDRRLLDIEKDLDRLRESIDEVRNSDSSDYSKYDDLCRQEIRLKSKMQEIEKDINLSKESLTITANDVRETLSKKIDTPVTDLSEDDIKKLSTLYERISGNVIGQDEAVKEVCQVVKRHRVGISNPNKPAVLFFAGTTGTGKTYLAKTLAKELFGSEKYLVRLDMSEYVEKMSVNNLYGSAKGYVGSEDGGILTEAVKKKRHCVLLLDEIEKANDAVHNVFLQLFDEGRMTDNSGNTVDFKDVIIIMTSNVGAKEISESGHGIGFVKTETDYSRIVDKSIKKKFKPEFINRIDKIVFFNKLNEANIKNIIWLELSKICERVENIGYSMDKSMLGDDIVNYLYGKIEKDNEYGARPVLRILQHEVEDRLTDYIINNAPEKGFTFTYETLFNKD